MSFRAQLPANAYAGTEETDSTGGLFRPGYVFGVETLPIEDAPGESLTPAPPAGDDQTSWVTAPPEAEPAPIASTQQTGADSLWKLWPARESFCTIALPDGSDIRSLWVPVVPVQIQISLGFASGAPMYALTTTGGETVPIPKGTMMVTLSVSGNALKPDIYIYATADIFAPTKTGVNGPPIAISNQQSLYDQMILGTAGIAFYWPLNDANGALSVLDYGPQKANGTPRGSASLGGAPLLNDGATSAAFDGAAATDIYLPASLPAGNYTIEFWLNFGGFGPGANSAVNLIQPGAGVAGAFRVGISRANSHLLISPFGTDEGAAMFLKQGIHHIAVTGNNNAAQSCNWYIDGNLVYSQAGNANLVGNFGNAVQGWLIGGSTNDTNYDGLVGNLSKVAMYSTILSAATIAAHASNAEV